MPRGGKRPGAGRKKGTPNKTTAEAREAFKALIDGEVEHLQAALRDVRAGTQERPADPKGYVDSFAKLAEFCVPKIQRIEKTLDQYSDEELLFEVRRRREVESRNADGKSGPK